MTDVKAAAALSPARSTDSGDEIAWNVAPGTQTDALKEQWPAHLPRRPSFGKWADKDNENGEKAGPTVIVFNANTQEGTSLVKVLSEKGVHVAAAVRVFTSRNAKALIKLENVTVRLADYADETTLLRAAEGCTQGFFVTKYWERFENRIETTTANNILLTCQKVGIKHLVLATFEDTAELRARNQKSQLVPDKNGRIYPSFEGMKWFDEKATELGIQITHMMTSYLDEEKSKKSLILMRGPNGKIVVQPYFQEL